MKLKLVTHKNGNREWIETDPHEQATDGSIIYLDGKLKQKLDNILHIITKGYDCIILIDGDRRTGKSNLGSTIMWYLTKGRCTINNYASGMLDASKKIADAPDSTKEKISTLQVDEGSLVFNSKDVMQKEQKQLMKVIDVVGQKNMVFIIVLPCFFELAKPIISKSRFLLHVYTDDQLNRGRFAYFGKMTKTKLYEIGKKNFHSYSKPESEFVGRFTDFHAPYYEEYLKLKKDSLLESLGLKDNQLVKNRTDYLKEFVLKFKANSPDIPNRIIFKGFGISEPTFYAYLKGGSVT